MMFERERAQAALGDLARSRMPDPSAIGPIRMKAGRYRTPEEAEAAAEPWQVYRPGQGWGGLDCHAWFSADLRMPASFPGGTVLLRVESGQGGWDAINPQFLLFLDGETAQGLDVNHTEHILQDLPAGERTIRIDLQAYSGRTTARCDLAMSWGLFAAEADRLALDLSVAVELLDLQDPDSREAAVLRNALRETLAAIDWRRPGSASFSASLARASGRMQAYFQSEGGRTAPIATCVGHTHIDVAWLWTLDQTRQKTVRSFATVLDLMDRYPEYVFMSSQAQLYRFLEEEAPGLFERVRDRSREGRWEVEGAMWVEADCNLASGEALVRQILYGKRYFQRKFGVECEVLWLPDVFGYSAALPQILRQSGIRYFMTTKLSWNQFNRIPTDTFLWKGIDGSGILSHFITTRDAREPDASSMTTYNGLLCPYQVAGAWKRYQNKRINQDVLVSYGFGDGGGGPTREMLEHGRRLAGGLAGCPAVRMGTVADYFRRLERTVAGQDQLPVWNGELYLEYHRGTYTSVGRSKRYNRKSELLYQELECFCSLAALLGQPYPSDEIRSGWETILLNQFHDILPGSSIREVYEESWKQYDEVLLRGERLRERALAAIRREMALPGDSVVVFNSLSFPRTEAAFVRLPAGLPLPVLLDGDDRPVVLQVVAEDVPGQPAVPGEGPLAILCARDVPARGHLGFRLGAPSGDTMAIPGESMHIAPDRMENDYFRILLDERGAFVSVYDKASGREVLPPGQRGNVLQAFEDRPLRFDNWDIDIYYREKMWEMADDVRIEAVETGPVRGRLRIERRFLDSVAVSHVCLYAEIPRIDFHTEIDWREDRILLKAAFPVDILADKATYDIQFGNVERPTHWNTSWDMARFEVCAHRWADLSEDGYGVSLLNDCKYGHDIRDGVMRLTLLKSGNDPNPQADRERHVLCYSLVPHAGGWREAGIPQMAASLNVPLLARVTGPGTGRLPGRMAWMELSAPNVLADTVKEAEDSGESILRLHEAFGRRTDVRIRFASVLEDVTACDLMERPLHPVDHDRHSFSIRIPPYGIRSFRIRFGPWDGGPEPPDGPRDPSDPPTPGTRPDDASGSAIEK